MFHVKQKLLMFYLVVCKKNRIFAFLNLKNKQMNKITETIREQLLAKADEKAAKSTQRFFKEEIKSIGVKTKDFSEIAKTFYNEKLKGETKDKIFETIESFLKMEYIEEIGIGVQCACFSTKLYEKDDIFTFERWINNYVTNWATCDSLCNHAVGDYFMRYPENIEILKKWAKSENLWLRRASSVSLIIPARKGMFFKEIMEIAEILLLDKEDMVQKGYGWLLKCASLTESFVKAEEKTKKEHLETVYNFIIKNKEKMPRTALRYAIEKMPEMYKKECMKKN